MRKVVEIKINRTKVKRISLCTPNGGSQSVYMVQYAGNWEPLDTFLKEHNVPYILEKMYDTTGVEEWNYFKNTGDVFEDVKKYLNPPPGRIMLVIEDVEDPED